MLFHREIKLNGKVLSTDEFFVKDGKYTYDHSKLAEAHAWNQRQGEFAVLKPGFYMRHENCEYCVKSTISIKQL